MAKGNSSHLDEPSVEDDLKVDSVTVVKESMHE